MKSVVIHGTCGSTRKLETLCYTWKMDEQTMSVVDKSTDLGIVRGKIVTIAKKKKRTRNYKLEYY